MLGAVVGAPAAWEGFRAGRDWGWHLAALTIFALAAVGFLGSFFLNTAQRP